MRTRNETLRRQTKIGFIEAATELIDEYGIENVTIRMISQKFGLHNSTIYRYFRDADQLLLLASLKYFSATHFMNSAPVTGMQKKTFILYGIVLQLPC